MTATKTLFEGLIEFQLDKFEDERGLFYESFKLQHYEEYIGKCKFVQDNCSVSGLNVLRGLHFQMPPFAQAKLVHVVKGSVIDVVVDLRKESKTFGQHLKFLLSEKNAKQLFIPRGFAHGFCSLEEQTIFSYKCDNVYHSGSERTLVYNDKSLGIEWPDNDWLISKKDLEGLSFSNFDSPF